ncbi:MFS transporter [Streptomyces lasalocidi]
MLLTPPETRPEPRADASALRDVFGPGLRRRTLVLWLFSVLSVVGYYGFGTLAPQIVAAKGYGIVAGLGFTALSFLGYPVGSALALPVVDRVERRTLIALSSAAMVVAGLGFACAGSAALVVVCGFAYTLFSNVFSSVSHVYLSEQYPTAIRATAARRRLLAVQTQRRCPAVRAAAGPRRPRPRRAVRRHRRRHGRPRPHRADPRRTHHRPPRRLNRPIWTRS